MENTYMSGLIPMVIEKEGNSERAMDIYSRLLKDRIIMLTSDVNPISANVIKAQLLFLEAEDPNRDITLYIDSPGGQVATGMGVFDTMQYIKPDVRTICIGQAASMGSLFLLGGAKGKRYALPNAEIMIHQPAGGAQGKASDIQISAAHIMRTKAKMHKIYADLTGQDIARIEADMDRDYYMTAEEALEYGIIDEILTHR